MNSVIILFFTLASFIFNQSRANDSEVVPVGEASFEKVELFIDSSTVTVIISQKLSKKT